MATDSIDHRSLLVKYMRLVRDATGSDHLFGANKLVFSDADMVELQECCTEAYLEEGE